MDFSFPGKSQDCSQHAQLDPFDQQSDDSHTKAVGLSGTYAITRALHEDLVNLGGIIFDSIRIMKAPRDYGLNFRSDPHKKLFLTLQQLA
jgi:hypothetical protein